MIRKIMWILILIVNVVVQNDINYVERQSYLPNIEISDVAEESKNVDGNETFLLYEDQCIQDANPWNEESKVKELPVYYNASCYGEDEKVDNFNEDELKEQLKDMAEKFGIKYEDSKVKKQGGLDQEILEWIQEKEGGIANEYLYFNECSISEKGIQVIVKDNKDTVIIFSLSLVLEKCQKENEYDQIVLIAKQLQEMFPKICGVDKYQYDINGGDYTIDGRQKWRIAFVLKKESVEEKNIINYNFHRIEVSLDENYNVYSITIHNENLNNKIGDYPIITVEEAKNRLLEQRYWTSATYPPNQDNISKIELIYKTSNYHKYFAPYYCFWVSNGEKMQNGLEIYSAFYISAIEEKYLK